MSSKGFDYKGTQLNFNRLFSQLSFYQEIVFFFPRSSFLNISNDYIKNIIARLSRM